MRLIIDTHIFLWALSDPKRISKDKLAEIEMQANLIYVSSISIAEVMIKSSIGKLDVRFDPVEMVEKCGFESLNFRSEDALLLKDMPFHHRDPFDRMLIAQSIANKYPIVTDDPKFQSYDCRLI
jgi:PIN domain nuclease of toxin-antitoxin system